MTRVEWCDDGFSTLFSLLCSLISTTGHASTFPQKGFVGRGSTSSLAIDVEHWYLRSILIRQLPKRLDTDGSPLWRLTLEWETPLRPLLPSKSGPFSVFSGNGQADDGEDDSPRRIRTILT